MKTLWTPINRHVNHLSWDRVTEIQDYARWPIGEFARGALAAQAEFVECLRLSDPEMAAWFDKGLVDAGDALRGA